MSSRSLAVSPAAPSRLLPEAVARAWRSTSLTRLVSLALFAGLALWIVLVYRDYGVSNDEPVQHTYGQLLWAWYRSGFADDSAFHYKNLYLYGGLFDLIAAGLAERLPMPVYELRHLLSASFGLLGLVAVWRLARLLAGEKAGILAVLLLAVTGMYGGAMFTHTKDVPFAAMMAWALYYITVIARDLPAAPATGTAVKLGVAVGCALGLRVGGIFAVFYLGVTLLAATVLYRDPRMLGRAILSLLPAVPVTLAIMAATWPWSVLNTTNFLEAATAFSHFDFDLETLFAGKELPIGQIPADYMVTYLAIKLPEAMLFGIAAGLVLAIAGLWRGRIDRRRAMVALLPLALAILFPIAFTLITRPPLYNGIRHFLFVIPAASVAAALGFAALWRWSRTRPAAVRLAVASLAGAVFAFNAVTFLRLHPFEYVGYNQLVGGLAGADGRYEGDYWSTSLRQAALRLRKGVVLEGRALAHPYKVAVCAEPDQIAPYLGPDFTITQDWDEADFFLTANNVGCDDVMKGFGYRTVNRLGVALATVKDLRDEHGLHTPLPWGDDDTAPPEAPAVSSLQGAPSVASARAKP
ncbi:ArnT family glycosyltransferase [Ancylobacter terrae]|uniref:ArnT family glycosyltransferase n=1 Tax=Ancylobacter sp. sgz301288 TaxID=3342077 RepID=UPI00385A2D20